MVFSSSPFLRLLRVAVQGSAYLLTHRSWTSRIGTGFRKCSFSRPRRRVTTRPASSSTRRCFITPKRVIDRRRSSALRVCPSCLNSSSSRLRRVGSARALNTSSMPGSIGDQLVTCQVHPGETGVRFRGERVCPPPCSEGSWPYVGFDIYSEERYRGQPEAVQGV